MIRKLNVAGLCAALALAPDSGAIALEVPSGPVILSVTGEIASQNAGEAAEFDHDMLEALPQRTTETKTPWYDGMMSFTGPLLSTVLDVVEADGDNLRVIALNDFFAEIPISDIREYPVILATRVNGERLSVREKGPLFVIYPFSDSPELYNEVTFDKSVWQVNRISVE